MTEPNGEASGLSPSLRQRSLRCAREPNPAIGKKKKMSPPSDAEVIGRSLGEPEAFGLIYDRHAATVLRFLGRRAGAEIAEGLCGELFRIAFERRKTFDVSRASARMDDQRSFRGFRMRTSVPRSRSWSARSGSARSRPRGACAWTARSTTRWSSSATA